MATTSSNKGSTISDDIILVILRNSFATLNEEASDVEDVYDETTQFMASSSKRVSGSGGANDSSLCEDGDYEMHDGYEDYAYDLTEEQ
ncbi:hypothetical protein Tco_0018067 [Tanacetum coccineum]